MSFTNLQSNVSKSECYCLNEQKNFPLENVFQGDDTLVLKSDADEQLMMYISFNESAKLHSINIGAADNENAPKLIHLFINRPNLGFSDMDDVEATQTIELSKSDLSKDSWTELKFVKFQRVQSLTVGEFVFKCGSEHDGRSLSKKITEGMKHTLLDWR